MFGYSPLQRQLDQHTKEQELRNAMLKSAGTTNAPVWRMGMLNAAMGAGDKLYEGITGKPTGLNAVQGEVDRMQQGYQGAIRGMNFKDSQSMRAAATKLHQTGMTDQALKLLKMADEVDSRGKSATDKYGTTFKGEYDGETVVVTPTNGAPKVFRMNGEEITEQVDPKKLTVHRGTTGETPMGYANLQNFMTAFKGGVDKDVEGFKRQADFFESKVTAAEDSKESLAVIDRQLELLDNPNMATGQFAEVERIFNNILGEVGLTKGDVAATTSEYKANSGALVGKVIKAFGAGTGLSDKDREFATDMVAGSPTLQKQGLKGILTALKMAEERRLASFNRYIEKRTPDFIEKMGAAKEDLYISDYGFEEKQTPAKKTDEALRNKYGL